jgi:DNA ligase-1
MLNNLGYSERTSHKENLVPMNTLGALTASGKFGDGAKYKIRIGTGFSSELRKEIWENREKYLGKLVKFKYFPGGVKEAPRFPVFLGFREQFDILEKTSKQLKLF